jgi:hypothetical protein
MPVSSAFALLRAFPAGGIKRTHRFQLGFLSIAHPEAPQASRPDVHPSGLTFCIWGRGAR